VLCRGLLLLGHAVQCRLSGRRTPRSTRKKAKKKRRIFRSKRIRVFFSPFYRIYVIVSCNTRGNTYSSRFRCDTAVGPSGSIVGSWDTTRLSSSCNIEIIMIVTTVVRHVLLLLLCARCDPDRSIYVDHHCSRSSGTIGLPAAVIRPLC